MFRILQPISTEKTIKLLEEKNTLVFYVDNNATKKEIKEEFEKRFKKKVKKVNVMITPQGKKKAYIICKKDEDLVDLATELGLM